MTAESLSCRRNECPRAEGKRVHSEESRGNRMSQFVSALAHAGNEGWLADSPRKGWICLTRARARLLRDASEIGSGVRRGATTLDRACHERVIAGHDRN
jgi:hypothetical protein